MTTPIGVIVDTSILLAIALAVTRLLAHRSAALRHAVLAAAVVAALAAPAVELVVPQWTVAHWNNAAPLADAGPLTLGTSTLNADGVVSAATNTTSVDVVALLAGAWALGAALLLLALIVGLVRLQRVLARAAVVTAGPWRETADDLAVRDGLRRPVVLLQSESASLLVTCGVRHPKIILPAGAQSWPADRVRIVLEHELAHIRRHDGILQIAGELLRVVHWFNPLVWLACLRLRQESEYACDDVVLNAGVEASDYASELLAVARQASGRSPAWAVAPGIAHPSTLERRIDAMLIPRRNRQPLTRRTSVAAALSAAFVIVPLAAASIAPPDEVLPVDISAGSDVVLTRPASETPAATVTPAVAARATRTNRPSASPRANAATSSAAPAIADVAEPQRGVFPLGPGALEGTVVDASGARLPGVTVAIADSGQTFERATTSDAAGRFVFRDLPPGQYGVALTLAGFQTTKSVETVTAGPAVARTFAMQVGVLMESINVTCGTGPAAVNLPPRTLPSFAAGGWQFGSSAARQTLARLAQAVLPTLAAQERPVRVGGNIQAPRKIQDVRPACPSTPPFESIIILSARINPDGNVEDVKALRNALPQEFLQAATDAIQRWKFTPTLLNGQPIPVNIAITVFYRQ
jgi:beta-lactamase regulating signal transducer with metallopeptidase domain